MNLLKNKKEKLSFLQKKHSHQKYQNHFPTFLGSIMKSNQEYQTKKLLKTTSLGIYLLENSYINTYFTYDKHKKYVGNINLHEGIKMTKKDLVKSPYRHAKFVMNRPLAVKIKSLQPGFLDETHYYGDSNFHYKLLHLVNSCQDRFHSHFVSGICVNSTSEGYVILLSNGSTALLPNELPGLAKEDQTIYKINKIFHHICIYQMSDFDMDKNQILLSFYTETNYLWRSFLVKQNYGTKSFQWHLWNTQMAEIQNHLMITHDFLTNFMYIYNIKNEDSQSQWIDYCTSMDISLEKP